MDENLRLHYLNKIRVVEKEALEIDEDLEESLPDSSSPLYGSGSSGQSLAVTDTTLWDGTYDQYVAIIPSVDIYRKTGKIGPIGLTRGQYNHYITGYAQRHIIDDNMFGLPDLNKFTLSSNQVPPRFVGEGRLRLDLVYYLSELYDKVYKDLGSKKITLTSTFRTIAHQQTIDGFSGFTRGCHMGAIAVDISATGNARYTIANAAYYMGFQGIAVGSNFLHIDIGAYHREKYSGAGKYISPEQPY